MKRRAPARFPGSAGDSPPATASPPRPRPGGTVCRDAGFWCAGSVPRPRRGGDRPRRKRSARGLSRRTCSGRPARRGTLARAAFGRRIAAFGPTPNTLYRPARVSGMGRAARETDAAAAPRRAQTLEDRGRYREALRRYSAAVRATPGLAEARVGKALCLFRTRRYEAAARCCDEALLLNPDDWDVRALRREVLSKTGGR